MEKKEYKIIKSLDVAFQINDIYSKTRFKKSIFYYSGENDYNIINVVFDVKNYELDKKHLEKVKAKMARKKYVRKVKVLAIIFGEESKEFIENDDVSILYLSYKNWKTEIKQFLPSVNFDSEFNIMKAYEEQQQNRGININSEIGKKYNSFEHKKQISNLPVFIVLLIATVFIPLIINLFWTIYSSNNSSLATVTLGQFLMLFGAANHDLMVGMNQWWRALTYPFVSYGLFSVFLNLLIMFLFIRFLEISIGKKHSFILLSFYPLIGIIASMMSYGNILYGPMPIYALFIGAGWSSTYKKNDFASLMVKRSVAFAVGFYVLSLLFMSSSYITDLIVIFSFIVGSSYGLFVNHNYKQKDWLIYAPIGLVITFILLAITFILIEEFTAFLPSVNPDVIAVIERYQKLGICGSDALKHLYNYYHFNPSA